MAEDAKKEEQQDAKKAAPKEERKEPRAKKSGGGAATVVIALLMIIAVVAGLVAFRFHRSNVQLTRDRQMIEERLRAYDGGFTKAEHEEALEKEKAASREEVLAYLKDEMSSGRKGPLDTVRSLFPDDIILYYEDGYIFQPVDETIPKHPFGAEDFKVGEDGFVEYTGSDLNVRTFKGIDVSSHQGNIDWRRVAEAGVKFAFIRVGFRGWGITGSLNVDETFVQNVTGAYENGIDVGVYWFPAALDTYEAEEEAEFVLETIEPYRDMITYPVVLDLELPETTQSRVYGQPKEVVTDNALAFLKKIEEAGYDTMVYGNLTTSVVMIEPARLQDYPMWIAWYDVPLYYPYKFEMWQTSAEGHVDGISTVVDLDIHVITE